MNRALLAGTLALCAFAVASAFPNAVPKMGSQGSEADTHKEITDAVDSANSVLHKVGDGRDRTQIVIKDIKKRIGTAADVAAQGWSAQLNALKIQAENSSGIDVSACIADAKDSLAGVSFAIREESTQCSHQFINNMHWELKWLKEVTDNVEEALWRCDEGVEYCRELVDFFRNNCLRRVARAIRSEAERGASDGKRVLDHLEEDISRTYDGVDRCTSTSIAKRSSDVERVLQGAEECVRVEINARDSSTTGPQPTPAASTATPQPQPTPPASTAAPQPPQPTPAA